MMKPSRILSLVLILSVLLGLFEGALGETYKARVSVDKALVRSGPTTSSKALGSLVEGTEVDVLAVLDNVAKIQYNGKTGYTLATMLERTDNLYAVSVSSAKIYKSADKKSKVLATVKKGFQVNVVAAGNGWAKVTHGTNVGFMGASQLTKVPDVEPTPTPAPVETKTGYAAADGVKVYKSAKTSSKVLATVKKGYKLNVAAVSGDWAKVVNGSTVGYVKKSQITSTDPTQPAPTPTPDGSKTGYTSADGVKVYQSAKTSSKVLTTLKKGYKLNVIAVSGDWAKVMNGSAVGYVKKSQLTSKDPAQNTLEPTMNRSATVTKKMNVYRYLSTSNFIGTVNKGDKVTVLAVSGDWVLIEKDGNRGYTGKAGMQLDPELEKVQFNATVIKSGAKVYSAAKTSASVLTTMKLGAAVGVTAYNDNWARILINGQYGYMQIPCLTRATYAALKKGDSGDSVKKMQQALENLGYMDSIPDGSYGTDTASAVSRLETELGLTADGTADNLVLQVLLGGAAPESSILSATLVKGNANSYVTRLQTRLTAKKYLADEIDGDFGSVTESAVKLFQKTVGLSQTGKADPATLKSLFSSSAPKYTGTPASASSGSTSSTGKWTEDYSRVDPMPGTASDQIEKVISIAISKLGCKYVYATSNGTTFDCSGFVSYCYGKIGQSLAHSAYSIGYGKGQKIQSISELQRGDIICFNTNESDGDLSDHVGIYLGNYQFIHASSSAGKVVISELKDGFYKRVFSWARRIVK